MSRAHQQQQQNSWPLPRGLFPLNLSIPTPTSPVTPLSKIDTAFSPASPSLSTQTFNPSSPLFQTPEEQTNENLLIPRELFPGENENDMTLQSHVRSQIHQYPSASTRNTAENNNSNNSNLDNMQPTPWPMPPRLPSPINDQQHNINQDNNNTNNDNSNNNNDRNYNISSINDNISEQSPRVQPDGQTLNPPVSIIQRDNESSHSQPHALRLLPSSNTSTDDDFFHTPPESVVDEDDISNSTTANVSKINKHRSSITTESNVILDRMSRIYPPGSQAPIFSNNLRTNEQSLSSDSDSTSVVDVLDLFTDGTPQKEIQYEDESEIRYDSQKVDSVRKNRSVAPRPGGVGEQSFLNISGLRSLFVDDSPFQSNNNGSVRRSNSDVAPPSLRVSLFDNATLARSSSTYQVGLKSELKGKQNRRSGSSKKKKKKKKPSADSKSNELTTGVSASTVDVLPTRTYHSSQQQQQQQQQHTNSTPKEMDISLSSSTIAVSSVQMHHSKQQKQDTLMNSTTKEISTGENSSTVSPPPAHLYDPDQQHHQSQANVQEDIDRQQIPRGKTGVVVRNVPKRMPMVGILRAETGFIMSQAELQGDGPPTLLRDNPNPKSLALFPVDGAAPTTRIFDEFEMLASPSSSSPSSSSSADSPDLNSSKAQTPTEQNVTAPPSSSNSSIMDEPKSRSLVNVSVAANAVYRPQTNTKFSGAAFNSHRNGTGTGTGVGHIGSSVGFSGISGGAGPSNAGLSRGKSYWSRYDEGGNNVGLVGKLSTGLRRAARAMTKRTIGGGTTADFSNSGISATSPKAIGGVSAADITLEGSLDEAVCTISYVCRQLLGCKVDVREAGRKIKIELLDNQRGVWLRLSLLLSQGMDSSGECVRIKLHQNRIDAQRSNIATLYEFYSKLELFLQQTKRNGTAAEPRGLRSNLQ